MKKLTLGSISFLLVAVLSVFAYVITYASVSENSVPEIRIESEDENCAFCDERELTVKEKYEELVWKALTDEKNLLEEGYISEDIYQLQIKPFNDILDNLYSYSEEELKEGYLDILYYHLDQNAEYEAQGEEIDKEFVDYIEAEIEKNE